MLARQKLLANKGFQGVVLHHAAYNDGHETAQAGSPGGGNTVAMPKPRTLANPTKTDVRPPSKRDEREKGRYFTLNSMDRRTAAAKRAFSVREGILADLGGEGETTVAQHELATNAATMSAVLEDLQARLLTMSQDDDERGNLHRLFLKYAATQQRTLEALGLRRLAKDVTLSSYIMGKADEVKQ